MFRPEQNAMRMQIGAERMCMPAPSVEQFVDAIKHTALANRRWVIRFFFFFEGNNFTLQIVVVEIVCFTCLTQYII